MSSRATPRRAPIPTATRDRNWKQQRNLLFKFFKRAVMIHESQVCGRRIITFFTSSFMSESFSLKNRDLHICSLKTMRVMDSLCFIQSPRGYAKNSTHLGRSQCSLPLFRGKKASLLFTWRPAAAAAGPAVVSSFNPLAGSGARSRPACLPASLIVLASHRHPSF